MHPSNIGYPVITILILVLANLFPAYNAETCTMDLQNDKKGTDDTSANFGPKADINDCNDACLADNSCLFASLKGLCFYWTDSNNIVDAAGETVYKKVCVPDACSMDEETNTGASNYKVDLASPTSLDACEDACQSASQCQYYVFVHASSSCQIYDTSSVTTSSQSGHTTGRRKTCNNGKSCCFDTTSDQGITESPTLNLAASQTTCSEICLSLDNCLATIYTGSSCKIFTSDPVSTASTGVTLAKKNCPEGASAGSFTYTDSCESSASSITSWNFSLLLVIAGYILLQLSQ